MMIVAGVEPDVIGVSLAIEFQSPAPRVYLAPVSSDARPGTESNVEGE